MKRVALGGMWISFTAGDDEQGLHALAPSTLRTIDGMPARDCSVSASHAFCVDPAFLSYDTIPLRATAWDVDDARFVGKWGYHLGLDSDGTANSGYLSRSLSVATR